MNELEQYIEGYFGVPNDQLAALAALFHEETLEKGQFIVREGEVCRQLSFISEGFARVYKHTEEREVTQYISAKSEFVTELGSLVFDAPARWNIQAISPLTLYTISSHDYQRIPDTIKAWPELEKRFLSKCFIFLEDRVFSFLSSSAEERYHHMYEHKRELFQHVPLNYIASMIGMTPETLSRIRKKSVS